jgi:hypothetical protein
MLPVQDDLRGALGIVAGHLAATVLLAMFGWAAWWYLLDSAPPPLSR